MARTLYSKTDLSDLLKLSISTIDNKMNEGVLQFYKIGKSVRFDDEQIEAFLSKQTDKKYRQKAFSYKHRNTDFSNMGNAFAKVVNGETNEKT